ncbi:glycosyltransferase [Agromyces aurantiacus]|uniref:Glycosyltransferase n=1 Tax=Agromyces aurantiacus TaxID=165814 RepID=A0ABV9R7E4_9MICO|nr:glycosyltransferase family 1 protein [Agromyces aurantiacus]MBM7504164.1 hypothetical protein [Agromyces aurantiacus]
MVLALPDTIAERAFPTVLGYSREDVPPPVAVPGGDVRLLIAPANYAEQGLQWARAASTLPGVDAVNLQIVPARNPGFGTDAAVPSSVAAHSRRWSDSQWTAVRSFTHVLIEAERPILGRRFGGDLRREIHAMLDAGVRVGFVSHGSDLRLPSRHADDSPWSPFTEPEWPLRTVLEDLAAENGRILDEFDLPVFVSTPDLIADAPSATWLPNIVDAARWAAGIPILEGRPRVLHAPTNPVIKGTALIEPTLLRLQAEGTIDYREVHGVPASMMPGLYGSVDVVLDQFRLGIYSTTSIEAMAAGRLVIARLDDSVRRHIADATGEDPPVVQADPDTLDGLLRDIAARPSDYAAIAARGPGFVQRFHGPAAAAAVLRDFLLGPGTAADSEPARSSGLGANERPHDAR